MKKFVEKKTTYGIICVTYSVIFILSGISKTMNLSQFQSTLGELGVKKHLQRSISIMVVAIELFVGVLCLTLPRLALRLAIVLLALFSAIAGVAEVRGKHPSCRCFGSVSDTPIGWSTIRRNAVLMLPGIVLEVSPNLSRFANMNKSSGVGVSKSRPVTVVALMLLAALQVFYGILIARSQQRVEGKLTELQKIPASSGDKISRRGEMIPDFQLDNLDGISVSWKEISSQNLPVALVFIDPSGCNKCIQLLSPIVELSKELAGRANIVVVTTKGEKYGTDAYFVARDTGPNLLVLFQEHYEVFEAIRVEKVPSALIAATNGKITEGFFHGEQEIINRLRSALA